MFEGLVQKLLLDYLGRYVKDIQKEQLKIGLWNGEVLMENVELVIEAFDYLQLPFALKQGRVGRLSIKIPWKKLGWDPIIIVLEDVFICASQRDDHEWSSDSVERREFAGKKAKLAAAELAKLSRRVCDSQGGQSFISYITAKILDGIQVSIRNVHVIYSDKQSDSAQFVFGLRFSSLTIMKQNPIGSSNGKFRGGQVNKIVEISHLGIYCSTYQGTLHLMGIENVDDYQSCSDARLESDIFDYMLAPFDVAISLVVNRSGKLENGVPQYLIIAELTALVMLLNEIQMQQILILWDYLTTCQLREKYGRYRPGCNSLSRKLKGWQRMWWHYAQESVLSDIRRKLRKSSWRYLGWRISYRRKYVSLYKTKLDFLRQEQPVDNDILRELEQMEKESDLDDILSYRSIAERESQELLLSSKSTNVGTNGGHISVEKQQNDDRLSFKSRGWLNWLSLGMLGAGGTEDSIQFSGAVSDEIVQDIYEATKFHPVPSLDRGASARNRIHLSSIKFNIHQITAALQSKTYNKETVRVNFDEVIIECNFWEDSWSILSLVNSVEMVDPYTKKVILLTKKAFTEENLLKNEQPSITVQVDMAPTNYDCELSLKVVLQPFEVTYDSQFLLNLLDFHHILGCFQFQYERVLTSLNGFEDVNARLLSKAEYILSNHTRIFWDISFSNIIIKVPWETEDSKSFIMVLELGSLLFRSMVKAESPASENADRHNSLFTNFVCLTSINDTSLGVQLPDLYDHFEIVLTDIEVNLMVPNCSQAVSILERFSASITLASCIIVDESMLKQWEVHFSVSSLSIHFSESIYGAAVGLIAILEDPNSKSEPVIQGKTRGSSSYWFSIAANLKSVRFHVKLADDAENSLVLIFALGDLDIQYAFQEFMEYWVGIKILEISTCTSGGETNSHVLCSPRNMSAVNSSHQHDMGVGIGIPSNDCGERIASAGGCFLLHYQDRRSVGIVYHKYTVCLNDVDIHLYPNIFGSLLKFYDRLSGYGTSSAASNGKNSSDPSKEINESVLKSCFDLQKFGFSNFYEAGSTPLASIPLNHFPFVTIQNSGSLSSLEQSLIHGICEWRRILDVRDKKFVRSPKFNLRKRSRMFNYPAMRPPSNIDISPPSGSCYDVDLFVIDLNLNGIRAHFHDSSCILGTLTLPITKSLLTVHGTEYLDLLFSVEGLLLSSSWSTWDFHEFLWGYSVPDLSPILNFRLRKENRGALNPQIEFSVSIQHVCCVLSPEFLSILIGYFSLPDWNSNGNEQLVAGSHKYEDTENDNYDIIHKFEILDSTLILPVESCNNHSLHLELRQLYCSFKPANHSEGALKDIPPECTVPSYKVVDTVHLVNVFGRDLSLSLVLLKEEGEVSVKLDQDTRRRNISLIAPLDADLWIRIPCESKPFCAPRTPTCIMMRIHNCQVIAEDDFFFCGVEAVLNAINQLLSIGRESECFTSDVLHFLQLKRSLKDGNLVVPNVSSITLTEVRFCVNSLSINLYRSRRRHAVSSELIAKADMKLTSSALFRNEIPLCLDVDFSGLALHSFHTSVTLLKCTSEGSISSGLVIHLSESDQGESELLVGLPSLHVWLHLLDWTEFIDLLGTFVRQLAKTSFMNASSENSNPDPVEQTRNVSVSVCENDPESPMLSCSTLSQNSMQDSVQLIVKSENISVSFHFPVLVKQQVFDEWREAEVQEENPWDFSSDVLGERTMLKAKHCKYIAIGLHSRDTELVICGQHAKLKSNVEKIRGMLETIEDQRVLSWPFFQLVQVNLLAEICDKQQEKHATTEIRIESLDVWLSYQILYFWHDVGFKIPEAGSSQFSFNSLVVDVQLMKASLLLTDGRWSCNGPLLEILLKNSHLYASITESTMDSSVAADLLVNYNNINKVMWEPFIEPWSFQLNMITKNKQSALQNTSAVTDVQLKSEAQLNLNVTEPLIEVIFRGNELIKDVWDQVGLNDLPESQRFLGCQTTDNAYTRRYAPYILQNETSLPLLFQVYHGVVNADDLDTMVMTEGNIVQPGSSLPIYLDETPEDQVFRYRSSQSSDKLNEKKSNGVVHHMISIQLDGTSRPSIPISMDVVGLSYFEVDFSKSSEKIEVEKNEDASKYNKKIEEKCRTDPNSAYVVPVVFDVSIQRYSKLIRLYSTVILLNATSIPLELRFDIPFGVSPKVLDPIFPGQEFPLPLHLAEAGRMRWRPLGNSFLWSEAHLLSNVLSQGNRLGFLRSFVCYPSHTSSDPFRCCISVQHISLPSFGGPKKGSSHHIKETVRHSVENSDQKVHNLQQSKRSIHYVTLTTPLLVKNYLPREVSLKIESAGITRSVLLSEVNNASIFHIDSTHDLEIGFHVHGFKACIAKFPRAETFITVARFLKTTYSLSETLAFYPELSGGPIYVTVEKVMDAFCGAREFCISVPFLLYNCSGLPLTIADSGNQIIGDGCTIPSCYHLTGEDQLLPRKHGLGLLFSKQDSYATPKNIDDTRNSFSKNYTIFQENANLHAHRFLSRHLIAKDTSARCLENSDKHNLYTRQASLNNLENTVSTSSQYEWPEEGENGSDLVDNECRKVEAFMYSPHPSSSASEIMVKLSTCLPECVTENNKGFVWSSPFFLVPASGSTSVVVPRTFTSGAFILSVTSSQLAGPFSGRTRAITFQPRYVISNACSKDLCYKQKGTDSVFHLGIGQHSHLHWVDTTRELLVSLRFSEPGWLWSGSFFPDHLGDTQVKMRNYVCGALNMIRVEVQNADVSIRDKKIVSSPHGNSGTHLILLSDDNTGFMPYRIDNFSKERLRIYQQKCENFETTVHSYTSCPYAWDEPCYPHRLVVELPGERVLGSYTLDDVNEQIPVYLPSTSEKPGRRLFLYIRAEGAVKVLSVIDSSYHLFKDMSETGFPGFKEKKKLDHKQETFLDYSERISVHISFFGISLIDSYPQELLYASANGINIDVLQSVERQRFSFQISSLQIDNQLRNATYPVILSFDHEYGGNSAGQIINKDDSLKIKNRTVRHISSDSSCEPIFWLAASKWRNKEVSLVSFEYINLRLAALRVELEEEIILSFFNFVRTVISRLQSRTLPCLDSSLRPLAFSTVSLKECSAHYESVNINRGEHYSRNGSKFPQICSSPSLPSVLPIGAPWQKIYLLARRQKKIYVEIFDLAPIKLTLSFSSAPWMLRNEGIASAESLGHISGTSFQRGLMALADVEGAPVYLRQLAIAHHMGSWESFEEILIRHYTRQLLHEMYKVFGSAGVIGNPMGFARNLGLGIKDFLSVPAKGILQSPAGLITGMAQGTTSLLSNTVYAISNATTQFSKSAQKSIVAFTFDDQAVSKMEKQQKGLASHSKGVLNEFLEGLTGFLQSPIRGAEKHGLPGVLSGIALGTAGLVARPVVSILEVTGKTAQSIRNRSSLHRPCRFQVRFPRPLDRELPLRTYSWEEAIGTSMLLEADDNKLKDEIFVMCKALKQSGKFVIITKRLVLVFMCLSLVGFGTPEFRFVSDPEWVIEVEISLESVIHVDREEEVLNIVGTSPENILKQHQHKGGSSRTKRWSHSTMLPLFQTSMEFASKEDAEDVLVILLSTIEQGTERGSGMHVLHQSNLRLNT